MNNTLTEEMRRQMVEEAAQLEVHLDERALDRFAIYLTELLDWNQRHNLTAIREPSAVVTRHFLDALTCMAGYDFTVGRSVIDIGTGAGFPGLPLKIAFPSLELSLLDSSIKKVQFLKHLCPLLDFTDIDIVHARAEEFGHVGAYRQKFHLALARGLAPLPSLVELCLPFVSVGGYFIAQKNLEIGSEQEDASEAILMLGGGNMEVLEVTTAGTDIPRSLIRIRKETPTPSAYPRRPGVPTKRPLGTASAQKHRTHQKYR